MNSVCSSTGGRGRGGAAGGHHGDRSGGGDAPLLFEQLRQLGRLEDGELRQFINDLRKISHFLASFYGSNLWTTGERPHAASLFLA